MDVCDQHPVITGDRDAGLPHAVRGGRDIGELLVAPAAVTGEDAPDQALCPGGPPWELQLIGPVRVPADLPLGGLEHPAGVTDEGRRPLQSWEVVSICHLDYLEMSSFCGMQLFRALGNESSGDLLNALFSFYT